MVIGHVIFERNQEDLLCIINNQHFSKSKVFLQDSKFVLFSTTKNKIKTLELEL